MDIFLITLSGIFLFVGLVGCFLPILPGPPLSYLGLLILNFTSTISFSTQFLLLWFMITLLVTLLDYAIPPLATRKYGGSKQGAWASAIGVIFGIFLFPPWGIIILPFLAAYLVELINNKDHKGALKAATGSFIGFLTGTAIKLIASISMLYYYLVEVF